MHHALGRSISRRPQMIVIHRLRGEMCLLWCDTIRAMPRLRRRLGYRWVFAMDRLIPCVVVRRLRLLTLFASSPLLFLSSRVVIFVSPALFLLSGAFFFLSPTLFFLTLGVSSSEWVQRIKRRRCHRHGMPVDGLHDHRAWRSSSSGGGSCLLVALSATRTCCALWWGCSSLSLCSWLRNGWLVHLLR